MPESLPQAQELAQAKKREELKHQVDEEVNFLAGFDEGALAAMPEAAAMSCFSAQPSIELEKPKSKYPLPVEFNQPDFSYKKSSIAEYSPEEDDDVYYM